MPRTARVAPDGKVSRVLNRDAAQKHLFEKVPDSFAASTILVLSVSILMALGRNASGDTFMGQVLVRELDDAVIERLKQRAESHHRSLEAELRTILEHVSRQVDVARSRDLADRIRRKLEGRPHSDSAELIREDRDR